MINRNLPRALGALAILATAFAVIAAGAVPAIGAQFQNVFVKNDAANPVPTAAQGVTQVAGTVSVAAPAEEVVQFRRAVTVAADETDANIMRKLYDVPDGKRLVIDNLAGNFAAHENTDFVVEIGPPTEQFTLVLREIAQPFAGLKRFAADEDGPIYADAVEGSTDELQVRILRGRALAATHTVTIAGRLVDLP